MFSRSPVCRLETGGNKWHRRFTRRPISSVAPKPIKLKSNFALAGRRSFVALRRERCTAINGLPGPEDVAVDHEYGIAYVSSQARKRPLANASQRGAIYTLDLKNDDAKPNNFIPEQLSKEIGAFHPLGIDLFIDRERGARLLVVNHADDGYRIEVFEIDRKSGQIGHRFSVKSHKFLSNPNDIVAYAWNKFYLTNPRHAFILNPWAFLDDILHLRSGRILHCCFNASDDATVADAEWTIADGRLSHPNGIAMERQCDPQRVYVALVLAKKIRVYKRTKDGGLERCGHAIDLPAAPDNLTLDANGDLWVGANPRIRKAFSYLAMGWGKTSPSVVLRVSQLQEDTPVVETIFSDNGELISASSVACHYVTRNQHKIIVGAPVGDKLLIVDIS